jgi:hypothetical protein
MRKKVRIAAGVAAAIAVTAFAISCGDSTSPKLPTYTATLNASNEVVAAGAPPVTGTGTGTATFVDHGTFFEYSLNVTGLTGVFQAHIHAPATTSQNASVIINLYVGNGNSGAVSGPLATGIITDANNPNFTVAALRALFDAGTAYANVHNTAFPGGAIRGQIARSN